MRSFFTKYNDHNAYNTVKSQESFPDNVGKNGRNEIRKYTATYCNNISVALVAAGVLIPLFGILPRVIEGTVLEYRAGSLFITAPPKDLLGLLVIVLTTFSYALYFRRLANRALFALED